MKKNNKKKLLLVFLLIFVYPGIIFAAGTNGFEWTEIGVGVREIGMGEQGAVVSNGVNAIYWNPAGILENEGIETSFMHNKWFQDIDEQFLGGIVPYKDYAFGLGIYSLGVKPFKGYDNLGRETEDVSSDANMINLSVSKNFELFKAGISLQQMSERLANEKASSIGLNFGVRRELSKNFKVGVSMNNFIASKVKFIKEKFSVPLIYRVGFLYDNNVLKNDKLSLGIELVSVADENFGISLGAEYKFRNFISMRIGYISKQDIGNNIRAGIGIRLRSFEFNYAFADYGDLGDTHRFSLRWYYTEWKKILKETEEKEREESLMKAKKLIEDGKYLEAVIILEELVRKYPDNKEYIKLLKETAEKISK